MSFSKFFRSFTTLLMIVCLTLGFTAYTVYAAEGWEPGNEEVTGAETAVREPASHAVAADSAAAPGGHAAGSNAAGTAPATAHAAATANAKPAILLPPPAHGGDHGALNDVASDAALERLRRGNLRFQQGKQRKQDEGIAAKDRNRLLAGQKPHTIVLSCSDSRVPPEIVFDQRLGELFVVRAAGEVLDNSVLASIEYALSHLGAQLILVLGHDSCGAVSAALSTMPNARSGSPYIDFLVADIQPRIATMFRQPASTGLVRESAANARGVVRDLIQRSTIVRERVSSGKLQVRSGLYHLDTGIVDFD